MRPYTPNILAHVGHRIVCVKTAEQSIAFECEQCGERLLDFECDDPPEKATDGLPETHMAAQEIADLSAEAGRPLTEEQAEAYRRRKLTWDGVERRTEERRKQ